MAQRRISPNVAMQARAQVQVRMVKRKKQIFLQDVSAMSLLSHAVLAEVHEETCRGHLLSHPLFRTVWRMHDKIMKKICIRSASFEVLLPHDELFHENHLSEGAYQVANGTLSYIDQDALARTSTRIMKRDRVVGSTQWLCWSSLWCHWIHCGTCKAVESAEVLKVDAECLGQAVRSHGPIRALLHEYATSYVKQVLDTRVLDDLEMPFTAHRDIVWSMDRQHQKAISNLALGALLAHQWRYRLHSKVWAKLRSEIIQGSSILVETCEADEIVERVVAVTALRLSRGDGRVLGCLLRFTKDQGMVPFPQFPGTKQLVIGGRLEDPHEAAKRLVESFRELRFASPLHLPAPRRDDVVERSGRFRLRTHYLRSVFDIEMDVANELPGLRLMDDPRVQEQWKWLSNQAVLPSLEDCFLLEGPGFVHVCAWVADDGYLATMKTKIGVRALFNFAEILSSAVDPRTGLKVFETQITSFSKFSEASPTGI